MIYTDEVIKALIECPKRITKPPSKSLKTNRGHLRNDFDAESDDGEHRFTCFVRVNEKKEKIFHKILSENGLNEENGNIYLETPAELLYPAVLQISQGISKVCSMRFFKREVIESLFYEMLDEFVMEKLVKYKPTKSVLPIEQRDDLEVDYQFQPNGKPLYLFAIKDTAKARIATMSCLEYQRANLSFESIAVHEDIEKLPGKDCVRITGASDKQFTSLDDFKQNAEQYLDRASK